MKQVIIKDLNQVQEHLISNRSKEHLKKLVTQEQYQWNASIQMMREEQS